MNSNPDEQEVLDAFTPEEIRLGIDRFAQIRLGMSGDEFIAKVRNNEPVHHLHERAQEVADLVKYLTPDAQPE